MISFDHSSPPSAPVGADTCLEALMLAAPAEIYLVDALTLELIELNPAACRNLQYQALELVGHTLLALAPLLQQSELDALAGTLAQQGEGPLALEPRRRDGSRYRLNLQVRQASRAGRAVLVAIGQPAPPAPLSMAALEQAREQAKEQERGRIARDLHDELGSNLSAIKMALAMLSQRLPADAAPLLQRAAYLDALVGRSIDALQRIGLDLNPPMLELGIVAALAWQCRDFGSRTGISCHFLCGEQAVKLPPETGNALYRVAQEALNNIAKHANANRVTLQLTRLDYHLSLKITDNGSGIVDGDRDKPRAFGLRGMGQRVGALGGSLSVTQAEGGGTQIQIDMPHGVQES
ncbi:MAG: sensor histidine kinase [Pseudomonadota bacterium]